MRNTGTLLGTVALATALSIGVIGVGQAQDATPTADDGAPGLVYANHFHLGTCDELDPAPAVPLADLAFPDWVGSLTGEGNGSIEVVLPEPGDFGNAPIPVAVATTDVQLPLAEIVSGGHALNVHDPLDPSVYVACGNVGGSPDERGDLFIGLGEHEGSGYSGVAWLHDNGGSTTVVVFLSHPAAQPAVAEGLAAIAAAATEEAAATPEAAAATPTADAEADASAPEATPIT
jgi:hypothetical protein